MGSSWPAVLAAGRGLGHNTVAAKGRSWPGTPTRERPEHYDRARGNLDRHGVHFLTAYVAGV